MSIIFNAKTGLKSIRRAPNQPGANEAKIRCPNAATEPCDYPVCGCHRADPLDDMGAGIWWCVLYSLCAFLVFVVVVVAAR